MIFSFSVELPHISLVAQIVKYLPAMQESRVQSLNSVREIPWRREWLPTRVFLPGESHGQRSLVGCSPWGRKKLDTTERLPLLPLPYDPAFPLLGIHPEKNLVQKDICTPVFFEGLFTIAKTRKQHKRPLAEEWIKKMWYIYTMEYSVQFSSVQSLSRVRLFATP